MAGPFAALIQQVEKRNVNLIKIKWKSEWRFLLETCKYIISHNNDNALIIGYLELLKKKKKTDLSIRKGSSLVYQNKNV